MKVSTNTSIYTLSDLFAESWIKVTLQDGSEKVIYFVDVDDEFQENDEGPELDCIIYNTTGSWTYGKGLPLYKIKSIELAKNQTKD